MKRTISLFLITVLLLSFTSFGTVFAADPTVTAVMSWDDLDTGRLTVTGTFPAEYAGKKVVMFVTDPAVNLADATVADSEKYFGIRQSFIAEDGTYRFDNLFYARPGTYQVNVMADTMPAPVTTSLTVTGTYYDFTVTANEGGTVTPNGTTKILRGDSVNVQISCNEGYQIKSIKRNGAELPVLSTFSVDKITENIALDVTFEKIPDVKPSFIKTYETYVPAEKEGSVTFGSISLGSGWNVTDYGIVYSETASEPTLNGEGCIALPHKTPMNSKGQYGIQLQGSYLVGKVYYTRTYVTYEKDGAIETAYGTTVVTNLQ